MRIDANDPKWTAYALGEIADEKERAEIESILSESAEARQLVEEIRETAGLLKEELQAEPVLTLTQTQRNRIEASAHAGNRWFGLRPAWVLAGTAAAALLISFLTIKPFWHGGFQRNPAQIAARIQSAQEKDLSTVQPAVVKSQSSNESSSSPHAKAKLKAETPKKLAAPKTPAELMTGNAPLDANASIFAGVSAGNMNIQRDGVTVNDVRQPVNNKASTFSKLSQFFKLAPTPVDAPIGTQNVSQVHGRIPPPPVWRPQGRWIPVPNPRGNFNTEAYAPISDNPFLDAAQNPLSTFSIDVDTASYSNVRRFLNDGTLPPKDAVRIEELLNYFDYDYGGPKDGKPFAVNFELTEAPWKPEHRLLRIGIKGREIAPEKRPNSNLVFLLDVSGSMENENKLPLVKESMALLVDQLTESDRVAIVVYASDTGVALESTSGDQKEKIRYAIDSLHAGGSTNGASGIQLAYQTAMGSFIKGGVNRVILATDGDFNVGITSQGDLTRLIEEKAKSGIFLSALGFGMGNYKDSTLELLANKGRGNYAYIDSLKEAKKVLVEQINSTLVTIAKDVKIQVEFNPRRVSAYRLIGYEDKLMAKEDFNDDAKQAGVIGAGHAVTALYELVPAGASISKPGVDPLKYQKTPQPSASADSDEVVTVKIRSKEPESDKSVLSEFAVKESREKFMEASQDFKFAAAVAAFGMSLRDSPYKGSANLERALEWAKEGKGADKNEYRQEFIRLIHRAISVSF